ncbi:MAG TPA: alpha/beta hydrolase [Bryobacteraceae bacterium]|nr:alpha/beta hydrolase [Bryobacteraceae bacterium]
MPDLPRSQVSGIMARAGCMPMSISERHNINIVGGGSKTIVFAHGYGCDQAMWRFLVPAFRDSHRIVLFDHVGAGKSDLSQYSRERYGSLNGYADDVLDIVDAVCSEPVIFVGHSVSSMIGVLAAIKRPEAFERLVLVGPSPCYINDGDYVGGFTRPDVEGLLQTLDENHLGWSRAMAPVIMKNAERPELASELAESFCRTDPEIAKHFARVTFLSDNRADLASVTVPTLVLQCSDDSIAPDSVGEFVHRNVRGSEFVKLQATGHCPHMSGPAEMVRTIADYLGR